MLPSCDNKGIPMTDSIRFESLVEPRDDEERELMDPETWDWESTVEAEIAPDLGAVLRVRFSRDEFLTLARVAREEGVNVVEFIRQTMLDRISMTAATERGRPDPTLASRH
jgi:hypothetical protein